MRRKNHTHQQDIDDLKKQNALLEQQGEWRRFLPLCQYLCGSNFWFYFLLLFVDPPQSVLWRRPKATARSRQTTRPTAACTQTARAAPCRPLTAVPTPAQNRNRTSCPIERSYAWSPARLSHAGAAPPPNSQTDSFCPAQPPSHLSALSPAPLLRPRSRAEDSVKEVLSCVKTLLPAFCPLPDKCPSALFAAWLQHSSCSSCCSSFPWRDFQLFKMSQ